MTTRAWIMVGIVAVVAYFLYSKSVAGSSAAANGYTPVSSTGSTSLLGTLTGLASSNGVSVGSLSDLLDNAGGGGGGLTVPNYAGISGESDEDGGPDGEE